MAYTDINEVADFVLEAGSQTSPYVIAIDGFGGSGKSGFAQKLRELLPDCGMLQTDDFIIYPHQPNDFQHDWKTLEAKVFKRIHKDKRVVSKTYNWNTLSPVKGQTIPVQKIMLIDGIGLLEPKYAPYFDLKIWIDCPLDIATARGKRRDKEEQGVDHDELWDTVWEPGAKAYYERARPDLRADIQFKTY